MVNLDSDVVAKHFSPYKLNNTFQRFFQVLRLRCAEVSDVTPVAALVGNIIVETSQSVDFIFMTNNQVVAVVAIFR